MAEPDAEKIPRSFRAIRVLPEPPGKPSLAGDSTHRAAVVEVSLGDLPQGEVTVRVEYSTLNYKDALSVLGVPGVTRSYPHTPGIDAAGAVVASDDSAILPGMRVAVGGGEFGANLWGGMSEYVRVPAAMVAPLPDGMDARRAMMYGTAGLTAAVCVEEIAAICSPGASLLVTGATGGVGSVATGVLSRLGFRVAAATGKRDENAYLTSLGAAQVIVRDELLQSSGRPLEHARWAGVVDTLGGEYLSAVIRACDHGGIVTAVGNAGGADLRLSVYPFILRGVRLVGIDTTAVSRDRREQLFRKLAHEWRVETLESKVRECELPDVPHQALALRRGQIRGRILVKVAHRSNEAV